MEEKQIKLLKALAKKIKSEKKERTVVVASLQSAKILTKGEKFTTHLKNLDRVFATVE
jgi:N-glycosylase/DNA lyase